MAYQRLRQANLFSDDNTAFSEQRLRVQGTLDLDPLLVEVAEETSLIWKGANRPLFPVPDFSPHAAWDATWDQVNSDNLRLRHRLDRAFAQLNLNPLEVIVGKQVVSTGVGLLFSAVSQVPRHPFVVVDPEYQRAEDAATVVCKGETTLEARFLPRVRGQATHNFHLRAKRNLSGYDTAVTAGRSDDKSYVGLEAAGSFGDSVLRGELVGYAEGRGQTVQALSGFDTVFSSAWSAQFEFFYNGFGTNGTSPLEPFRHRSTPYRSHWYAGVAVTWEIDPRLKAWLLSIVNLSNPSALWQIQATYSLSDNFDFVLGQFLNTGNATAEFGGRLPAATNPLLQFGLPDLTYALVRYAF